MIKEMNTDIREKMIEIRTQMRLWDKIKCTDMEDEIYEHILDTMNNSPIALKVLFEEVHKDTERYFLDELAERCMNIVLEKDGDEYVDNSTVYMFLRNSVIERFRKIYFNESSEISGHIEGILYDVADIKYLR